MVGYRCTRPDSKTKIPLYVFISLFLTLSPIGLLHVVMGRPLLSCTPQSVSISFTLCISLFLSHFVSLSLYLCVSLFLSISLSITVSVSVYLSLTLSLSLSPHLSFGLYCFICPYVSLPASLSLYLYDPSCLCLNFYLISPPLPISVCLIETPVKRHADDTQNSDRWNYTGESLT